MSRGMMVEFVKQVHLQKEVGAGSCQSGLGTCFGGRGLRTSCEAEGEEGEEDEGVSPVCSRHCCWQSLIALYARSYPQRARSPSRLTIHMLTIARSNVPRVRSASRPAPASGALIHTRVFCDRIHAIPPPHISHLRFRRTQWLQGAPASTSRPSAPPS